MADNTQTNIISVQIDESAKNKLVKGLQEVRAAQRNVASENAAIAKSAANSTQDIRAATSAIAEYENRLKQVQASGTDLSGDIASSFGGIRGALGSFGATGASPALDILEGFADIGEFAPRLKVQLTSVGDALRTTTSAAGGIVSGAGDAIGAFTGIGASLGTVAVVALPVAAAIGGIALALNYLSVESQKNVQFINAQLEATRQINEAIATGLTTEDAQAQLEELQRLREQEAQFLAQQNAAYTEATERLGVLTGAAQLFSAEEEALATSINTSRQSIQSYDAQIRQLETAIADGELAANDTRVAEAELARTREQESQRAIQLAEQNTQRLAQLESQRASLIENRAIQSANAEANAALEARFAREDEAAESLAHFQNLADIAAQGQAKIESIQAEIAALPAEQAQELASIQAKETEQLSKLNSDYFANQIKAAKDFNKESERIAQATKKAVARLTEDIDDNLADAVRGNDVAAFLKIQRDGQKELRRSAEDADDAERQRVEDFIAAQETERAAFQQKQAEIYAGIEREKQQAIQGFNERRAALQQQIEQERANTQQALADAQTRYAQSEALEQQAAQRDAQRLALRQQQEDAAFQRQIGNINRQIAGVGQIESAYISSISRIQSAINSLRASGSSSSGKSSSYSKASTFSPNGAAGSAGGKGVTVVLNQNNTVGDIATGAQVTAAIAKNTEQVIGMVTSAFSIAQG
jgi:hypothetical protein